MNNELLEKAHQVIPDAKTLIILASKRANQLAMGARPMVRCKEDNYIDVALCEIAENKLTAKVMEVDNDFMKTIAEAKAAALREASSKSEIKD